MKNQSCAKTLQSSKMTNLVDKTVQLDKLPQVIIF